MGRKKKQLIGEKEEKTNQKIQDIRKEALKFMELAENESLFCRNQWDKELHSEFLRWWNTGELRYHFDFLREIGSKLPVEWTKPDEGVDDTATDVADERCAASEDAVGEADASDRLRRNFYHHCYREITKHYRKQLIDTSFVPELLEQYEKLVELAGKDQCFALLEKAVEEGRLDLNITCADIRAKREAFCDKEKFTSCKLETKTAEMKNLLHTLSVLPGTVDANTEGKPDDYVLAVISNFCSQRTISYAEINTPKIPLIPARGMVPESKLKEIELIFENSRHKICAHRGTANVFIRRLYMEDYLYLLICLQKALGIDFFASFEERYLAEASDEWVKALSYEGNRLADAIREEKEGALATYVKTLAHALYRKKSESFFWIDPDAGIDDMIRDGWNVVFSDGARNEYRKAYNRKVEAEIQKAISEHNELNAMSPHLSVEDLGHLIRAIFKIRINKNGIAVEKDGASHQNFVCHVESMPAYQAVLEKLHAKLEALFVRERRDFSKSELAVALGKCAAEGRGLGTRDQIEISDGAPNAMGDATLSVSVSDLAIAGLLRKEKNNYVFRNGFEKTIFWSRYLAADSEERFYRLVGHTAATGADDSDESDSVEKIVDDVVSKMIGVDEKQEGDHRKYKLVFSAFCALTVLLNVNRYLREKILERLCGYASDYDSAVRQKQEVAVMVLSYFLVYSEDLPHLLKKRIFDAAFLKQLYPFQMHLYRVIARKDRFFVDYPMEPFKRAVPSTFTFANTQQIYPQPAFYLLQGLCGEEKRRTEKKKVRVEERDVHTDVLANSIALQDMLWVSRLDGESECVKKALKEQLNSILTQPNRYDLKSDHRHRISNRLIVGYNLCFLAFADLVEGDSREKIDRFLRKYGVLTRDSSSNDCSKDLQTALLKAVIATDALQRERNGPYCALVSGNPSEDEMVLICGASRMVNSYLFEGCTVEIGGEQVEKYWTYLCAESIRTRYFWFLVRLLAYVTCDGMRPFTMKEIIAKKLPNDDEESAMRALADAYQDVVFLQYDRFPKKFSDFCNEISSP